MDDLRIEPGLATAPDATPRPARPRRKSATPVLAVVALLAAAGAAWHWLPGPQHEGPAAVQQAAPAAAAPASAAAIQHPLPPAPANELVQPGGVAEALANLLGKDAVLRFLQTTDFPRRAVATLDGLGRAHAPVAAWPVLPTPGRFSVQAAGATEVIAAANAARYGPLVAAIAAMDPAKAVDVYRRMYPILQQAYRELGFGDRSLNDRLLEVIDLLLATPEPATAPEVVLIEVKGPIAPAQPWTRYEYAQPGLQGLAAGQKVLLRVGADNRRQLKAKLQELKAQLLQVSGTTAPRLPSASAR